MEPLTCPRCALAHPISERFCRNCGMPLVYAGTREEEPITDAHERARKVRPQYARGDLMRVTGARNLADGEMIQGILLDQGIPSMLRRARGFDVPDFLAAGPRDVLVPESGYEAARDVLSGADMLSTEGPPGSLPGIGSPLGLRSGYWLPLAWRRRRLSPLSRHVLTDAAWSGSKRNSGGVPSSRSMSRCSSASPSDEPSRDSDCRIEDLVQMRTPGALDVAHPRLEGKLQVAPRPLAVEPRRHSDAGVRPRVAVEEVEDGSTQDQGVAARWREGRAVALPQPGDHRRAVVARSGR